MTLFCIGDIQGCDEALERLLSHIGFSPSRDTAYLLGDLVNRGPDSLAVLRRCFALEGALRPLLGNHDLHLLASAQGIRPLGRRDTLEAILQAPDRHKLLHWLRCQPLAYRHEYVGESLFMVHAGLLPHWTTHDALGYAAEVQDALRSAQWVDFLQSMYGNKPTRWHDDLQRSAFARHHQCPDAAALLHARWGYRLRLYRPPRRCPSGLAAVVRCPPPTQRRRFDCLWALVHAGLDESPRSAGTRYRLRLGGAFKRRRLWCDAGRSHPLPSDLPRSANARGLSLWEALQHGRLNPLNPSKCY